MNFSRAEIIAEGFVQGVGFRYFVYRNAVSLSLTGYTKNLYSGEVFTIAEGPKDKVEQLFLRIKEGPSSSRVKRAIIKWQEYKNEFSTFEIKH